MLRFDLATEFVGLPNARLVRALQSLRSATVQRWVAVLVVAAFLSLVSTTVACEIDCFVEHPTAGQTGEDEDRQQPALCHLAAAPGMASDGATCLTLDITFERTHQLSDLYRSYNWPPPEHKPRA